MSITDITFTVEEILDLYTKSDSIQYNFEFLFARLFRIKAEHIMKNNEYIVFYNGIYWQTDIGNNNIKKKISSILTDPKNMRKIYDMILERNKNLSHDNSEDRATIRTNEYLLKYILQFYEKIKIKLNHVIDNIIRIILYNIDRIPSYNNISNYKNILCFKNGNYDLNESKFRESRSTDFCDRQFNYDFQSEMNYRLNELNSILHRSIYTVILNESKLEYINCESITNGFLTYLRYSIISQLCTHIIINNFKPFVLDQNSDIDNILDMFHCIDRSNNITFRRIDDPKIGDIRRLHGKIQNNFILISDLNDYTSFNDKINILHIKRCDILPFEMLNLLLLKY